MGPNIDADVTAPLRQSTEKSDDSLKTSTRVLISLVVIFGILSLTGSAILLWRVIILHQQLADDVTNKDDAEQDMRTLHIQDDPAYLYPEYFTTDEQHMTFLKAVANATEGIRGHGYTFPARKGCGYTCTNRTCPTYNMGPSPGLNPRLRREVEGYGAVHHSCCTSYRKYINQATAINIVGEMRKVVQMTKKKQYFFTDECIQNPGCSGCECRQPEPFFHQAVVYSRTHTRSSSCEIDIIQVPGCCKCLNIDRGRR